MNHREKSKAARLARMSKRSEGAVALAGRKSCRRIAEGARSAGVASDWGRSEITLTEKVGPSQPPPSPTISRPGPEEGCRESIRRKARGPASQAVPQSSCDRDSTSVRLPRPPAKVCNQTSSPGAIQGRSSLSSVAVHHELSCSSVPCCGPSTGCAARVRHHYPGVAIICR